VRTRDSEERTTVVEDIALAALAARKTGRGRATPSRSWLKSWALADDVTREIPEAAGDGGLSLLRRLGLLFTRSYSASRLGRNRSSR